MNLKPRAAAFTLIETLFAVAITAVVFISLYTGMATGFDSIRSSQENLRATQIMTEKFEAMRLYNWTEFTTPGFVPDTFTAEFAPKAASPGITYNGTVSIFPVGPEPYTSDLRGVSVTLTWKSGNRVNTRTLTSYVARYGLQNYLINY
jgi:type II secretory pathway pseudopilin PulG